jgi:hypothetical protein
LAICYIGFDKRSTATEKWLLPKLKEERILSEYKPEGLWVFSGEVERPYICDGVAVPFSACYIFNGNIKNCVRPSFNKTTDFGHSLDDSDLSVVADEIKKTNAISYAADGGGLQWVSFDDELTGLDSPWI